MILYLIGFMFTIGLKSVLEKDEQSTWEGVIAVVLWPLYLGWVVGDLIKKVQKK